MAVAASTLGIIGATFYGMNYALLSIPHIVNLTKAISFGKKLDQALAGNDNLAEKMKQGLKTLMVELEGTTEEKGAFLKKIVDKKAQKEDGTIIDLQPQR